MINYFCSWNLISTWNSCLQDLSRHNPPSGRFWYLPIIGLGSEQVSTKTKVKSLSEKIKGKRKTIERLMLSAIYKRNLGCSFIFGTRKCVRCPWALKTEHSVHFFSLSLLISLFLQEGIVWGFWNFACGFNSQKE